MSENSEKMFFCPANSKTQTEKKQQILQLWLIHSSNNCFSTTFILSKFQNIESM